MPPITSAPMKQQRRALACLNCRAARAACEGQPPPEVAHKTSPPAVRGQEDFQVKADNPCPRCARLSRVCIWVPSHRTGRPRKRLATESPTSSKTPVAKSQPSPATATTAADVVDDEAELDVEPESDPSAFFQQLSQTISSTTFDAFSQPPPSSSSWASQPAQTSALDQFPPMAAPSRNRDLLQSIAPELTAVPLPFNLDPSILDSSTLQSLRSFLREDNVNAIGALLEGSETPASTMPTPADVATPASQMAATSSSLNDLVKRLASAATPPGSAGYVGFRGQPSVSPTSSGLAVSSLGRDVRSGLSAFFTRANQFLPVLGTPSHWILGLEQAAQMNQLTNEARLAMTAACAIGERLSGPSSRAAADKALATAKTVLDEVARNPPLPPSPATPSTIRFGLDRLTHALQGLLLLSYVDYGLNDIETVERCMDLAKLLCGSWGVHRLDSFHLQGQNQAATPVLPLEGWAAQQPPEAVEEVENLRRIWWELFLLDNMLVVTTGGQVVRRLKPLTTNVAVHLPADPGEPLNGNPFRECYDVRVRACALMSEAFAPSCPSIQEASARLVALDALHSDLLVRAHAGWREARAEEKALSDDAGGEGTEADAALAAAARAESFFFSMVILHAGRIHLHRNVWLSDLNVGLSSCSLDSKPGNGGFDGPATSYDPLGHQLTAALAAGVELPNSTFHSLPHSVEAITNASTTILDLVRSDYLERMAEAQQARLGSQTGGTPPILLPTQEPTSPFLRHGPFFACALMVSAYGAVVGVAAKKQEDVSQQQHQFGGFNGQSQLSPPSSSAAANACSTDIWRQRTFLSHLCFAEATAVHMAKVFPRIRGYAAEIQTCRAAVDASAPALLT